MRRGILFDFIDKHITEKIYKKAREAEEYNEDVDFYNKRLREAKKQARRREAADWKNNMTNREGYTY